MNRKCKQCNCELTSKQKANVFCSHSCSAKHSNALRESRGWTHSEATITRLKEVGKVHGIKGSKAPSNYVPMEEHVGTTKWCRWCKEVKPIEVFSRNANKSTGYNTHCKVCHSKYYSQWYKKHKTSHKIVTNNRRIKEREENRKYIYEYLKAHPCIDCNEANPVVLEFDHVRGEKRCSVSRLISNNSLTALQKEIAKCDVRCANCHKIKTAKARKYFKHTFAERQES